MSDQSNPTRTRRGRLLRRVVLIPAGIVVAVVVGVGLYLFQPWLLFVDKRVDEAIPVAAAPLVPSSAPSSSGTTSGPAAPTQVAPTQAAPTSAASTPENAADSEPVELATGEFISHEHATTGSARVLELADGSRILRFEGLDTSNGPDLRVWLTDAPVIEGREGWFVFDDGEVVELGELKGNQGNQNYVIPPGVDLAELTSVSIWCIRFSVSFGAANLQAV